MLRNLKIYLISFRIPQINLYKNAFTYSVYPSNRRTWKILTSWIHSEDSTICLSRSHGLSSFIYFLNITPQIKILTRFNENTSRITKLWKNNFLLYHKMKINAIPLHVFDYIALSLLFLWAQVTFTSSELQLNCSEFW